MSRVGGQGAGPESSDRLESGKGIAGDSADAARVVAREGGEPDVQKGQPPWRGATSSRRGLFHPGREK
jgi:hypothetical protein